MTAFYLLHPEQLPAGRADLAAGMTRTVRATLAGAVTGATSESVTTLEWLAAARRLLERGGTGVLAPHGEHRRLAPSHAEFDRYFEVERVCGQPAQILLRAVVTAYEALVRETCAATSLTPAEWDALESAFLAAIAFMTTAERDVLPRALRRRTRRTTRGRGSVSAPAPLDPHTRWRAGHHVFFVLIQVLIVALNCLEEAVAATDLARAADALDLATAVMRGSGAALRFAGDFAPDEYERVIRPSMSPPHVSEGFSGILSLDHKYMIATLRRLHPVFQSMPAPLQTRHQRYVAAVAQAYEAHKFVCERFQGDVKPSLRMAAAADKAAVEVLDRLKHNRLQIVTPDQTARDGPHAQVA